MTPHDHRELSPLSRGCARVKGRLPTCYSPVCQDKAELALTSPYDLHALDTPPAFILSQDQTLKYDMVDFYLIW